MESLFLHYTALYAGMFHDPIAFRTLERRDEFDDLAECRHLILDACHAISNMPLFAAN